MESAVTEDPELEDIADRFMRWAADEDLLAFPYTGDAALETEIQRDGECPPEAQNGEVPRVATRPSLYREFGVSLDVLRRTFESNRIHFIGTSVKPRALILAHAKKAIAADGDRLPHRTTSGIHLEYVPGRMPEIRLASAAISSAKTQTLIRDKYPCGTSISIGNVVGAGTLGALVEDKDGKMHGLSCNHVTGLCNNAQRHIPIVAPGILDVRPNSLDPFTIGHHARLLQLAIGIPDNIDISENIDAALFGIADPDVVSSMQQSFYDTPTSIHRFRDQMPVEKVGRSTGHTRGWLHGYSKRILPVPADVGAFKGTIYFKKIMLVTSVGGAFADRGDSGSLVVTGEKDGKREAVGIIFAVSPDRTRTYVAPIGEILTRLRVTLKGGHNHDARISRPAVP